MKVLYAIDENKNQIVWWMEALLHAEQNKDFSSELLRKIEEAVSGTLNNSKSSRIASRLVIISFSYVTFATEVDKPEHVFSQFLIVCTLH